MLTFLELDLPATKFSVRTMRLFMKSMDEVIRAKDLLEDQKYHDAVQVGIEHVDKEVSSENEFIARLMNLKYSLCAAAKSKLYFEFLKLFDPYIEVINTRPDLEPPGGFHNHTCLMQAHLEAVVFAYCAGDMEVSDIKHSLNQLEHWTLKTRDPSKFLSFNTSLSRLCNLIFEGKPPFFTCEFELPVSLPLPDREYIVEGVGTALKIKVQTKKYSNVTSIIGDRYFSKVKIHFQGFTATDNYWSGPFINKVESFNQKLCLEVVNEVVLASRLINDNLRLKLLSEVDIGCMTTQQFNGEGESFHMAISFGFGGNALVDVLSKQELNDHELELLAHRLNGSKLEMYERLLSEAKMNYSNGNFSSAFYLLNSSCESFIERSVYLAAMKKDKENEYEQFMLGSSFCNDCELFIKNPEKKEPPRAAMAPSIFAQLNFLRKLTSFSKSDLRRMNSILSKIRNDDLRNSLVHGRTNTVTRSVLLEALKSYEDLKKEINSEIEKNCL